MAMAKNSVAHVVRSVRLGAAVSFVGECSGPYRWPRCALTRGPATHPLVLIEEDQCALRTVLPLWWPPWLSDCLP